MQQTFEMKSSTVGFLTTFRWLIPVVYGNFSRLNRFVVWSVGGGEARENMARYLKSTTRLAQTQSKSRWNNMRGMRRRKQTHPLHTKWDIR